MVPTVVLYQLQQSVVSLYCNIGLLSIYPYYSLEMHLHVFWLLLEERLGDAACAFSMSALFLGTKGWENVGYAF